MYFAVILMYFDVFEKIFPTMVLYTGFRENSTNILEKGN